MTIERPHFNGPITFECDARCNETFETHCCGFEGAKAKLKAYGWRIRKIGEEWAHLCPKHIDVV